jgi:hypothetical protein
VHRTGSHCPSQIRSAKSNTKKNNRRQFAPRCPPDVLRARARACFARSPRIAGSLAYQRGDGLPPSEQARPKADSPAASPRSLHPRRAPRSCVCVAPSCSVGSLRRGGCLPSSARSVQVCLACFSYKKKVQKKKLGTYTAVLCVVYAAPQI